jgi:hypothetical protein
LAFFSKKNPFYKWHCIYGFLQWKKVPQKKEKKMMPPPQLCTRGKEKIIDHGISHKLKIFHYYKTLAISTQIIYI